MISDRLKVFMKGEVKRGELSNASCERIREAVLEEIVDGLLVEGRTAINRFGVFKLKKRAARTITTPLTGGVPLEIPESLTVRFKPAKALLERLVEGGA